MAFTIRLLLVAILGLVLCGCARGPSAANESVLNLEKHDTSQINNIVLTKRVVLARGKKKTSFYELEETSDVTATSEFGKENEIANLDCIVAGMHSVLQGERIISPAEFWETVESDNDTLEVGSLFDVPYSRALKTLDIDFIIVAYHQLIDAKTSSFEAIVAGGIFDENRETSAAIVVDVKNKRLIDAVEAEGWHKTAVLHMYVVIPLAMVEYPVEEPCQMVGRHAAETILQSLTTNKAPRIVVVAAANDPYATLAPDREKACSGAECMTERGNTVGITKEAGTYCPNADLGHADAQLHIGDIYNYGAYGNKVDRVRAWVWYSLADQNGEAQAAEQLSRVTTELTPKQLEEANRELAAWKPGQCMQELTADPKGADLP